MRFNLAHMGQNSGQLSVQNLRAKGGMAVVGLPLDRELAADSSSTAALRVWMSPLTHSGSGQGWEHLGKLRTRGLMASRTA